MRKTLLFCLLAVLATSCATYKRCSEKFSSTILDSVTVYQPVTITVQKDSAVLRVVTDTTYLYKEVQQGRARVVFERTPQQTRIEAHCDTVVITKRVPFRVPGPTVTWGVAPWYKRGFWLVTALLVLNLALLMLGTRYRVVKR